MDKSLELFIKQVRESTRFVNRDFFELITMQSSGKNTGKFAEKTCQRMVECYVESMSKYFSNLIFTVDDLKTKKIDKEAILINVLDGFDNLTKSLPYFASVATKLEKKGENIVPTQSVMVMHGINKMFYAISGTGAWAEDLYGQVESRRLRVAGYNSKNINNLVVGTSYNNLDLALKISKNVRIFGSDSFLCAMVACGKLDAAVLSKNELTTPSYKLFLQESAGIIIDTSDVQIATNVDMHTTINKLF